MKRLNLLGLLLTLFSLLLGAAWYGTQEGSPLFRPIQQYKLVSDNHHVKPEEIEKVMQAYVGLSFWEVDLQKVQSELTRLDWASGALVKRIWPDQLYVRIEEQKPVARWGATGLVNQRGVVFYPKNIEGFHNLVVLDGQLSNSEKILRALSEFQLQLNPVRFVVAAVSQQMDDVWRIDTFQGSSIILEEFDRQKKLKRFVAAYSKLPKSLRNSQHVYDLRYSNGFIIGEMKLHNSRLSKDVGSVLNVE